MRNKRKYVFAFIVIAVPMLVGGFPNGHYAQAGSSCRTTSQNFQCVDYLSNYDGDTLSVNIKGVHPLIGEEIDVRVRGVDTAEKRGSDGCELEMAKKAQKKVQKWLQQAHTIDLNNVQRGQFFRIVADVVLDGESLAQRILKEGLGVPYNGGRKPPTDWCDLL